MKTVPGSRHVEGDRGARCVHDVEGRRATVPLDRLVAIAGCPVRGSRRRHQACAARRPPPVRGGHDTEADRPNRARPSTCGPASPATCQGSAASPCSTGTTAGPQTSTPVPCVSLPAELGFIAEQRGDAAHALTLHQNGLAAARAAKDPRSSSLGHRVRHQNASPRPTASRRTGRRHPHRHTPTSVTPLPRVRHTVLRRRADRPRNPSSTRNTAHVTLTESDAPTSGTAQSSTAPRQQPGSGKRWHLSRGQSGGKPGPQGERGYGMDSKWACGLPPTPFRSLCGRGTTRSRLHDVRLPRGPPRPGGLLGQRKVREPLEAALAGAARPRSPAD